MNVDEILTSTMAQRFDTALDKQYAIFFDLTDGFWEYKPNIAARSSFIVEFKCCNEECGPLETFAHVLAVTIQPTLTTQDALEKSYSAHIMEMNKYGLHEYTNPVPALVGANPSVSGWEMTHGHGGGFYSFPWFSEGDWEVMWKRAETLARAPHSMHI